MSYATRLGVLIFATTLSTLGYGQWGGFAQGVADAQQRDLERQHQLQMQREAEQTALELARIQSAAQQRTAQAVATQPEQPSYNFWESGNVFLAVCSDLGRTGTVSEITASVSCSVYLRGLMEGISAGAQWAGAMTKTTVPQPVCLPPNVTLIQMGQVLAKYIRAHPEIANERTAWLALAAFKEAWPCSQP